MKDFAFDFEVKRNDQGQWLLHMGNICCCDDIDLKAVLIEAKKLSPELFAQIAAGE